ncbi:MAG: hypothetical protein ABR555_10005 [Pyrinomonadaceae bacterium]
MSANNRPEKILGCRFVGAGPESSLELVNTTDQTLKCIEVLTVFLKDENTPGGGPSQFHIRFEGITSMHPRQAVILRHRTWTGGKPVDASQDKLERLRDVTGKPKPYVLDISWDDKDGKKRFQRIPVGH